MIAHVLFYLFLALSFTGAHNTLHEQTGFATAFQADGVLLVSCPNPYIVQPGDTLASIARRCGVPVATLMHWNGLKSARVFVGQRLLVRSWQTPFYKPMPHASASKPDATPTPHIAPRINP